MTLEVDDITGSRKALVKTEVEEAVDEELSESELVDHFLNSFTSAGADPSVKGEGDDDQAEYSERPRRLTRKRLDFGENSEDEDWTAGQKKPKQKRSRPTGKRDGKDKQAMKLERNALSKREKRSLMSPEEKEKQREKWKLEKQQRRQLEKQRREAEEALRDLVAEEDDELDTPEERSPRRPARKAKLKQAIKAEPESAEEDYDDFADKDYKLEDFKPKSSKRTARKSTGGRRKVSTPRAGGSKKKVHEMTEAERIKMQEKWREEARERRARKRGPVKSEENDEHSDGAQMDRGRTKSKSTPSPRTSLSMRGSASRGRGGRKKVDEMTEEERQAIKEKWREEARLKRARKRDSMTAEQREEHLREQRERKQIQRALAKEAMTDEQREEVARKVREKKKAERAQMTPEQKREVAQKKILQRIEKRVTMTEEEKQAVRMKRYFQRMARMASMTPEEIERKREQNKEYLKRWREKCKAEDVQRKTQQKKPMTPEQREKYLAKLREGYKRKAEQVKQDPVKWEKLKQKWRDARLRKRKKLEEMGKVSKRRYYRLSRYPNETPEQKMERIRESKRLSRKRIQIKKRLAIQKLLESGKSMQEIKEQMETPQQREDRLMRNRIWKAKFDLRKRLEAVGTSAEEIEQRCAELDQTYQPTFPVRPYKPRAYSVGVDPDELALLDVDNVKAMDIPAESYPANKRSSQPIDSTYKTTTSTRPSGRPSNNLAIQKTAAPKKQAQLPPPLEFMGYAASATSPAGASSCSYVSAAETPEPVAYPATQQHHHHYQQFQQQQQYYQNHGTNMYHQTSAYSHHHQGHSHSLQHILDSISYQGPSGTPNTNQVNYQHNAHQQSSSGHQAEYASSDDNYSPPGSPGGGDDPQDYSSTAFGEFTTFNAPSQQSSRKAGRPRMDRRRKDPNSHKRGVKSTRPVEMCEECGVAYSNLKLHKIYYHNPDYRDKKCQICGEGFKAAKLWHHHFIHHHKVAKPPKDDKERTHMCNECGQLFREKYGLEKHRYYSHGDGLKKENWNRCPVCPGEKRFKGQVSFNNHMRKTHPDYNRGGHDCYRCENKSFAEMKQLSLHVKQEHPDSFFPCQFCKACRFTKYGLNFHYIRCAKIGKEAREEKIKSADGIFSLDRVSLQCEFCRRRVTIGGLTRHYWEMHNVREDSFTCSDCGKVFKRRDFWAVHMEEKHLKSLEEMQDTVRSLNVKDRAKVVVENLKGLMGGVPSNTPGKAAAQLKRAEMGLPVTKGGSKKQKASRSKGQKTTRKRRKGGVKEALTELSDNDDGDGDKEKSEKVKRKRRRKVIVVAEEDEELGGADESGALLQFKREPACGEGTKSRTPKRTKPKKYEESDDEEEEEDASWTESEDDDE